MQTTSTNLEKNKKTSLKLQSTFEEFALWFAKPPIEQLEQGIQTQGEFSLQFDVSENTLTAWRRRPEFISRVNAYRHEWAFAKTSDVIYGIYRASVKGNPHSQKLYAQLFMGFREKSEVEVNQKVEITQNDIRHLIEQLPEELKQKHYANLRELLDDTIHARDIGAIEDSSWTHRPPTTIPSETNQDASDLQGSAANELSKSHPCRLCKNMVREIHENHHQGAQRWW